MRIRPATAHDYEAYARLFPELHTPDPTPPRARWDTELWPHTWIADDGHGVAGLLYWQLLDGAAYVRQLVVDPAHRREGIGRRLMEQLAAHLRTLGVHSWDLNVDPANGAAVALYESLGFRQRYAAASLRFPWSAVDALPASAARPLVLDPSRDGEAEGRWALPPGQLAQLRLLPGRAIIAAEVAGLIVGVAAFDPDFPGAFPFRVAAPAHARALLEGIRPHARHEHMQLVAEDDEALETLLVSVGAEVRFRFVHLHGTLP